MGRRSSIAMSKPARITRAGRAVLDHGQHLLRVMDDLKAIASPNAEPAGPFRLGIAHALAQSSVVGAVQRLAKRFSRLQPVITTDLTRTLLEQIRGGGLDAVLTLAPIVGGAPSEFDATVVGTERFVLIRSRERGVAGADLDAPWVVNPPGCLIRQALEVKLREMGSGFRVAAEIHNVEMQLSLVAGGLGLGIVPVLRVLAAHPRRRQLEQLTRAGVTLSAAIVFVRAGHLGQLVTGAVFLQETLAVHFAQVWAAANRRR